jgi:hypothetical protein
MMTRLLASAVSLACVMVTPAALSDMNFNRIAAFPTYEIWPTVRPGLGHRQLRSST